MVESELGEIPEGWKVGKLKDTGKIICGKTPSKAIKEYLSIQQGDVPKTEAEVSDLIENLEYKPDTTAQNRIR